MSNWSASNYRQRIAKRLALQKPEWVTNPETGATFLLRRVGAMAAMIANHMPTVPAFADQVAKNWKDAGVDVGEALPGIPVVTPEKIAEGERDLKLMARVVGQACVIPKLVSGGSAEDELDPAEMDDSDVLFIFRWATGQVGNVKGGEIATMDDLSRFRKRPARGPRTRNDAKKQRNESEPIAEAG
jgi:hypothetical protein